MTSWPSSPRTTDGQGSPTTTSISRAFASSLVASSASETMRSTSTRSECLSGSPLCSRERSMRSLTRLVRRCDSTCIRALKRCTASGSSLALCTASASSESAPTGVLSSCDTLATKSRRTASMRCASDRSSTSTSAAVGDSAATRTRACRIPLPSGGRRSSRSSSRITPSRRTAVTSARISGMSRRPPSRDPEVRGLRARRAARCCRRRPRTRRPGARRAAGSGPRGRSGTARPRARWAWSPAPRDGGMRAPSPRLHRRRHRRVRPARCPR